jgi:inosine-uridine nucleoside N-ribohydrolase
VIIDTDGGIDDMRAILLMLASTDIDVLAITTSTGVLTAHDAFIKVSSLCNSLGRNDVPIGISEKNGVLTVKEILMGSTIHWIPPHHIHYFP